METRIYIPKPCFADVCISLTRAGAQHTKKPLVTQLPMNDVRCFELHFRGLLETLRLPFAAPFFQMFRQGEFHSELHEVHGPDWFFLGGDIDMFARMARVHAMTTGATLLATPFDSLGGTLPRSGTDDTAVTLERSVDNYNQPWWQKLRDDFLKEDIENWHKVSSPNTTDWSDALLERAQECVPDDPKLIVDFGCGLGNTTLGLAEKYPNAKVVGFDASPEAIEVAQKKLGGGNLSFMVHDISDAPPFEENSIDIAVSINAMMYGMNQRECARNLFKRLSPDGVLINFCRTNESHTFWEFPFSLAFPPVYQLQQSAWGELAARQGYATSVQAPLPGHAFKPAFFSPGSAPACKDTLASASTQANGEIFDTFSPFMSHQILVHSANATDNRAEHFPGSHNRMDMLEYLLKKTHDMPQYVSNAAIAAWMHNATASGLRREAGAFINTCVDTGLNFEALFPA